MDREKTLKDRGFMEDNTRRLWISRDLRKAFSHDAVRDYDSQLFEKLLNESVPDSLFRFYMHVVPENFATTDALAVLKQLGLSQLRAEIPLVRMTVRDTRS